MYTFAKTPAALYRHIQRAYQSQEPFRRAYDLFQGEYIGGNTGHKGGGKRPVNFIYETVEGLRTGLAPEQVRHTVIPKQAAQALDATKIGLQLDSDSKEMRLGEEVQNGAFEAFFAPITIFRLGEQAGPRTTEIDGEILKKPTATLDLVMFEDLAIDTDAKSWNKRRFCFDRIEVSRQAAIDTGVFGRDPKDYKKKMANGQMPEPAPKGVEVMSRSEAKAWFENAQSKARVRSSLNDRTNQGRVTRDNQGGQDEDEDTVLLWYGEVRQGGCSYIVVIPDSDSQPEKFLLFEKYRHHPDGPYIALKFGDVSGNILGSGWLAAIYDLHELARKASNKLIKQLMQLKIALAYSEGAADDAMRVHKHADDGPVRVQDVTKIATLQWGGVPKDFYPALQWLAQEFGNQGGGVRQMAGTEEGGNTLGQEQMLTGKNERRRSNLVMRVRACMREIAEKMAFQTIFNNPVGIQTVDMPLGQGMSIPVQVNPSAMQADALSFQYDIEPYNYASADPTTQRQLILQFLTVLQGLLPMIAQGAIQAPWVEQLARHYFGIESTSQMLGNLAALGQQAAAQMGQANPPVGAAPPKPSVAPMPPGQTQRKAGLAGTGAGPRQTAQPIAGGQPHMNGQAGGY